MGLGEIADRIEVMCLLALVVFGKSLEVLVLRLRSMALLAIAETAARTCDKACVAALLCADAVRAVWLSSAAPSILETLEFGALLGSMTALSAVAMYLFGDRRLATQVLEFFEVIGMMMPALCILNWFYSRASLLRWKQS